MRKAYIIPQIDIEEVEYCECFLAGSDDPSGSGDNTLGNEGREDHENGWGIGVGTGGALSKKRGTFSFDDDEESY